MLIKKSFTKALIGVTKIWLTQNRMLQWTDITASSPIGQKHLEKQAATSEIQKTTALFKF